MPFDHDSAFIPLSKRQAADFQPSGVAAKEPRMDVLYGIKSRALHKKDRAQNLQELRAFFVPRVCSECGEVRKAFRFLRDEDVICRGCSERRA